MYAFAASPPCSGAAGMMRKKRKSALGSSAGYPSEDDESPDTRRPTPPTAISIEDVAVAKYFTRGADSPQTKHRKLAIAEREVAVKEADARVRQTEAATMRDLLRSTHDSPTSKAKRLSIEEINATARMKEVEVKAEETKAKAQETKATQSFMLQVMGIMGKLADKL